jgi:feruloyl esterase
MMKLEILMRMPVLSARILMVLIPGLGQCGGGMGQKNSGVDFHTALEEGLENDVVSERIFTEHCKDGEVHMDRPLCPYPEVEVYYGGGDPNRPENFTCQYPREP